jgi:hypothetical protein
MNRRLIAALVAGFGALAACSGGGSPAPRVLPGRETAGTATNFHDLVLQAATKATEINTSRFAFTMSLPGPGARVELSGTGAVDNETPILAVDLDIGALGAALPGGGTTNFVFDGGTFYLRFPEALAGALGGRRWVRIALSDLSKQSGADLEATLEQFRSSDPGGNLAMLLGAADDVRQVGTEEVRGERSVHLRLTVDVDKALGRAPGRFRSSLSQLLSRLGSRELPVDVWIGEDSLPRRIAYEMDLSRAGLAALPGAPTSVRMRLDIFDYGKPVDSVVPPPDQTMDLSQLQQTP